MAGHFRRIHGFKEYRAFDDLAGRKEGESGDGLVGKEGD
jgi:hypothetical protein